MAHASHYFNTYLIRRSELDAPDAPLFAIVHQASGDEVERFPTARAAISYFLNIVSAPSFEEYLGPFGIAWQEEQEDRRAHGV